MSKETSKKEFEAQIQICVDYFREQIRLFNYPVRIYTHHDADGICSGAILAKTMSRAQIPYHLTVATRLKERLVYGFLINGMKWNLFEQGLVNLIQFFIQTVQNVMG